MFTKTQREKHMNEFNVDFLEDFDFDNIPNGVEVNLICEYEFDEGDPHSGLPDSFNWSVYMYVKGHFIREVQDELSLRDWNLVEAEVNKHWEQYIKDEQESNYY